MTTLFETQDYAVSNQLSSEGHSGEPNLPFQAAGRWKTADAYAMRRIGSMKDADGNTVGFRPMIQQGRGPSRINHSEVFRITSMVDAGMAMAMAQRWRDKKESELGIGSGQISSKSAARFVPGISLIVSNKPPYRACWKWTSAGNPTVTKYIGKRTGYRAAYSELVQRICEALSIAMPTDLDLPMPNPVQYASLRAMGVDELPDRRGARREWTAP